VIAGPYLTAMLADLGCDVIKVESPQHGDDSRTHFPPGRNGEAAIFVALNRSKRSAVIDLATEEGRSLARELAAKSDILVENFRPGAMQRLGLDYESLREINPRLIYCAISGYGYTGKFRDLPGYDPITQAETGYMYMTGDASMPPIRAGGSVVDIMTGMHAALAIVSAVHARSHTGMGQFIDAPLFDTALSALGYMLQGPLLTGVNPQRLGNTSFFMAPNGLYDAADGKMMISCGNDRLFARLCSALGADDMPSDPRFATNAARLANLDAMNARMSAILAGETRDYWIERLRQEGVPAGSVRSPLEALASDETAASGMLHEIDHPLVGRMSIVGSPLHFSDTPAAAPRPSPGLDQHTDEVLAEVLGLDSGVIARLRADRHIGRANPATKKAVSS
jgi:crotonobetainyl-CoA:carnitine CoA-transferase CaiB-like acyl-CoA transferase